MSSQEVRDLAGKSAAELRRRGWGQGGFVIFDDDLTPPEDCRVCAVGAILAAEGVASPGKLSTYGVTLIDELMSNGATQGSSTFSWYDPLTQWNDEPGRTIDDVLAVFDAVATGQTDSKALVSA